MEKNKDEFYGFLTQLKTDYSVFQSSHAQALVDVTINLIEKNETLQLSREVIHDWLNFTANSDFMKMLESEDYLSKWADCAFKLIQSSDYSFNNLLKSRVDANPRKVLFIDMASPTPSRFSYEQVWQRTKETAVAIYKSVANNPRVAIFCENSPESALVDLACLAWDIPVSPLNVHFSADELLSIFKLMNFNIIVTDSSERLAFLEEITKELPNRTLLLHLNETAKDLTKHQYLPLLSKTYNSEDIERTLNKRHRLEIDQVCTIMFTSGSTGVPKGVSFSNYNLVSKRFARAAALPNVGKNEVLLCFLPLFHTFGRYLEMMGMIYWNGTYVFAGNPSSETLLSLFPKVNPTGFISVPIRWVQLYERIIEETESIISAKDIEKTVRSVIGSNLRWGLSAAGYLDPKIFIFFQKNNVELASGFGMTEATGGITMTPPGDYSPGTVGKPLPGIYTKFHSTGEMLIRGDYVANYVVEKPFGSHIPFPVSDDLDFWMPTGDVFKVNEKGYYEIVDRVKDIYKNNKGQTVSPRNVETKFEGVPGIKHVFLAGDARAYNTLLIVPDFYDVLFEDEDTKENPRKYFQRIIAAANASLAPYERVVNFTILQRDFSPDLGEVTPKGSFNRKAIENNFSEIINHLYQKDFIEIIKDGIKIIIPLWIYRDSSWLEDDVISYEHGIINKETSLSLNIAKISDNKYQVGDLIYTISSNQIDLGAFALQPFLWIGNAQLISFLPIKVNWDFPLKNISAVIFRDFSQYRNFSADVYKSIKGIKNYNLILINKLICDTYFNDDFEALKALEQIETFVNKTDERTAEAIRLRLQAIAYHPTEEVRCFAYRIILMDDSMAASSKIIPAFLESGLSFLNEKSIEIIAQSNFERRRLNALRKRLLIYREQLNWPQSEALHKQLEGVFRLLVDFVKHQPEYYPPVRVELSNWVLHKADPILSKIAEKFFWELSCRYEESLDTISIAKFPLRWINKIVFEDTLSYAEIDNIKKVLIDTTFLKQSVILAFDEYDFDLEDIPENGIWISKIYSLYQSQVYRLSINCVQGKHYDLQMVLNDDLSDKNNFETILWLIAVSGYPLGPNVLPKLGCARPELEARTMAFLGDLTVWERIRQISSTRMPGLPLPRLNVLKRLFTEGLAAFFRAWRNSAQKIIPGAITPSNVVVSDLDFRDGATVLSLASLKDYTSTLSLIEPMINNFFRKALHHYSWTKDNLELSWLFDAAIEGIGEEKSDVFFEELLEDLAINEIHFNDKLLSNELKKYIAGREDYYYHPLPLIYAIDKYHDWQNTNPNAIPQAKEQSVLELYNLYRLSRFPEIARYQFYRHTYFAYKDFQIRSNFDKLLKKMNKDKKVPATQLIELSDLQAILDDPIDRQVFSKMVFPGIKKNLNYDLQKFKDKQKKEVIVRTTFKDNFGDIYLFREPAEPAEIGLLYRLFYKEKFSKVVTVQDQFIILFDSKDRIAGGITYQLKEDNSCLLDGIVLASQFQSRGLGRAMMEDFIIRMQSLGIDIIKTTFFVEDFYTKLGFTVDKRWGLLVKILNKEKYAER